MIYRLKEPWGLRGYPGKLLCLDRLGSFSPAKEISMALFDIFDRCDGEQDFGPQEGLTAKALRVYTEAGVLEQVDSPRPVQPWQRYRFVDNRRVPQCFLSITGRCNLRCLHCFMASDRDAVPNEFTLEQIRTILARIDEAGIHTLTISGGEPLCHPDFGKILDEVSVYGMEICRLHTNGILFRQETVDLLRGHGQSPEVVLSFDGLGVHDWMRNRPGAQAEAVRAIRLASRNGLRTRCAVNVNRRSLPVLRETARFLYGEGVRSLYFVRTSESPRWLGSGEGCLSAREYWDAMDTALDDLIDLNRNGLELQFFNGPTLAPGITAERLESAELPGADQLPKAPAWCRKALSCLFVSSTGLVMPCDSAEGGFLENGLLGADSNILEVPLTKIVNGSGYSRCLETTVQDVADSNPECADCPWFRRCRGGGCRLCGTLWKAAASGDANYYHREGAVVPSLKSPLTCEYYRGGHYERMLGTLRSHPL